MLFVMADENPDGLFSKPKEVKRGRRAGLTGDLFNEENQGEETPPFQRKTGGWAEESKPGKRSRRQQQQQQDRRLDVLALNDDSTKKDEDENDEMPVIPDLEDVYDEEMTTQIAAPPSVQVNRLDTFRKLDTDLHRHAGLSTLGGEIDLKLLTKVLYPESDVLEDDVPWEWDRLFAEVASELQQEWKKSSKTTDSPVKDDRS
eukprot:m.16656 g.16656  ORF g.16656 m.16656 type:complete len:202 (+) comp27056_c0_seq2:160-765(+)